MPDFEMPPILGEDRADYDLDSELEGNVDAFAPEPEPVAEVETEAPMDEMLETEETEPASETDPLDDYKSKAEMWEQWSDRWARDPAAFMQAFYGAMTPDQQAAFLTATGAQAPQAQPDPTFEPQSPVEEWLVGQRKTIEQMPQFAQAVTQEFSRRDQFIHDSLIRTSILEAKLDAALQLLEANLPDVDRTSIEKALADGKVGYKDAVEKHYRPALEKAVKATKQAKKPRPSTPANMSGDHIDIRGERDMVKIYRMLASAGH